MIDNVSSTEYVGGILCYDGSNDKETNKRIRMANQQLYKLRNI